MAEQESESVDELLARYKELERKHQEALEIMLDESTPSIERRKAYEEAVRMARQTQTMWRQILKRMREQ